MKPQAVAEGTMGTAIQERLRAIGEDEMYCFPAATYETCQQAANYIDSLEKIAMPIARVMAKIDAEQPLDARDGGDGVSIVMSVREARAFRALLSGGRT